MSLEKFHLQFFMVFEKKKRKREKVKFILYEENVASFSQSKGWRMKLCLIINFPPLRTPYVKYTYFNIARIFIYPETESTMYINTLSTR